MDKSREMDLDLMSDAKRKAKNMAELKRIQMTEYVTHKYSKDPFLTSLRETMIEAIRTRDGEKYAEIILKIEDYVNRTMKRQLAIDIRSKFGEREMYYFLNNMR